jgi:hypothetical protein
VHIQRLEHYGGAKDQPGKLKKTGAHQVAWHWRGVEDGNTTVFSGDGSGAMTDGVLQRDGKHEEAPAWLNPKREGQGGALRRLSPLRVGGEGSRWR